MSIRPLVQSVSPPPNSLDPTFIDTRGVTHEALSTDRVGDVSLCGQLRWPSKNNHENLKRLHALRAFASPEAPEGVDCMTCLVRRVRLDVMIAEEYAGTEIIYPMIQLDLRIAP